MCAPFITTTNDERRTMMTMAAPRWLLLLVLMGFTWPCCEAVFGTKRQGKAITWGGGSPLTKGACRLASALLHRRQL
jgi:hypothetical protein